jgi:hypothetical protein
MSVAGDSSNPPAPTQKFQVSVQTIVHPDGPQDRLTVI